MFRIVVPICLVLMLAGAASAVVVTLSNETQTTLFTATVTEQANVTVPAAVGWTVNNVSASTASAGQSVSATVIVLTDGNKLRIEIAPDAADFTPAAGGSTPTTWASEDVSWVGTWTNGTANNAAMSNTLGTYVAVADMTAANAASLSSANLVFTLAAKAAVDRAGAHTLAATWKFSSF